MSSTCSHDDDDGGSNDDDGGSNDRSVQIVIIENTAEDGTWRVTSYNGLDQNENSDFAGYDFDFNYDGSLIVTNGSDTMRGAWSINSNNNIDIDFNISLSVPNSNNFEDLDDDWAVVTSSFNRIELINANGSDGDANTLTLQKL